MFDPVQAPSLWHAFESVLSPVHEFDPGAGDQILDRGCGEDFAGSGQGNARRMIPLQLSCRLEAASRSAITLSRHRTGLAEATLRMSWTSAVTN